MCDQSLPTLCRYETTGNTSTSKRDPKSGPIGVTNQWRRQATRRWCGIPCLDYSPSHVPLIGGRHEGERGYQAMSLPGREGPPYPPDDKIWNLEYVDMEEFLPVPRSLRLAEQGKPAPSLQESLVGAFNQFQAIQSQKTQHRVLDIITWLRCFTLYIAVMAKQRSDMVQCMVAHLHTVLKVHQKAPKSAAWLEYDIQFRMEMAAREDWVWMEGDPWQYVSCLPGPSTNQDPFDLAEIAASPQVEPNRPPHLAPALAQDHTEPAVILGKGKRPIDSTSAKAPVAGKRPATKKPKRGGTCHLFNKPPRGCPYGEECMFTDRCSNCGVLEAHGQLGCPLPPKYLQ